MTNETKPALGPDEEQELAFWTDINAYRETNDSKVGAKTVGWHIKGVAEALQNGVNVTLAQLTDHDSEFPYVLVDKKELKGLIDAAREEGIRSANQDADRSTGSVR